MLASLIVALSPTAVAAQPFDLSGQAEDTLYRLFFPSGPQSASFLVQLVTQQLATFPVSSSSGSFSESDTAREPVDPLMPPKRAGLTYGPLFAERTLTLGRAGKFSAGASVQRTSFTNLGTFDMSALPLRTTTSEGASSSSTLRLRLTATSFTAFANVGLRDNLDVGATIPIMRVALDGEIVQSQAGAESLVATGSADGSGLGDIALRIKYRPGKREGERGVALAGEARLPTGDSRQLLGAGRGRLTGMLVYTSEVGSVAPHVNFAYTRWIGHGSPAAISAIEPVWNTFGYAAGVAARLSGRVTLAGDFVGRYMMDAGQLQMVDQSTTAGRTTMVMFPQTGNSHLELATAGVKLALGHSWLAVTHFTFPVSADGLKPGSGIVFGLEREFQFRRQPATP